MKQLDIFCIRYPKYNKADYKDELLLLNLLSIAKSAEDFHKPPYKYRSLQSLYRNIRIFNRCLECFYVNYELPIVPYLFLNRNNRIEYDRIEKFHATIIRYISSTQYKKINKILNQLCNSFGYIDLEKKNEFSMVKTWFKCQNRQYSCTLNADAASRLIEELKDIKICSDWGELK